MVKTDLKDKTMELGEEIELATTEGFAFAWKLVRLSGTIGGPKLNKFHGFLSRSGEYREFGHLKCRDCWKDIQ